MYIADLYSNKTRTFFRDLLFDNLKLITEYHNNQMMDII